MPELEHRSLKIDGETLVCEFALADKNAVILHGAGKTTQRKNNYAVADELQKQGMGVVMFDFSGHGESTGKLTDLSLARRVKQAAGVIDVLMPPESPLYLIGFSMSGHTACDLLPHYGKRVKGVLLACPAIYRADIQDLRFGTDLFTTRLRKPSSWKSTNATKYLSDFDGKTVIAIGSDDQIIPKGVVSMLKDSAKHLVFKEYEGASHALTNWLTEHPSELAWLIEQLLTKTVNLKIKQATPDQAQLIADILNDGTEFKRKHNDTAWQIFSCEGGLRMATSGNTYIAYIDKEPVGTVALEWEDTGWEKFDPNAAYIHRVAIRQGYHGQHLGEQILTWAEQQAKANGNKYLRLDCSPTNKQLCRYYERQGFVKVDQHYFADYGYTANLYQRPI